MKMKNSKLLETFGDPIGSYAGAAPVGVTAAGSCCSECGMMPTSVEESSCGCGGEQEEMCSGCGMLQSNCECPQADVCPSCGMMSATIGGTCECAMTEAKKQKGKGPSKKTAAKILKGADTFAEKMKKVSGWADQPAAAASWMMHKATGKWPREKR